MILNKQLFATLRIMKTAELKELENAFKKEEYMAKQYKRRRFWSTIFSDLIIILPPFLMFGDQITKIHIIALCLIALITNIVVGKMIDGDFEKTIKLQNLKYDDDLNSLSLIDFEKAIKSAFDEEIKNEKLEECVMLPFTLMASDYFYEIKIKYKSPDNYF